MNPSPPTHPRLGSVLYSPMGSSRLLSRSGSRQSFQSSSSGSSSIKKREKRRFNMNEVIENIFEQLVGDYAGKNKLEVPVRFYEFYNGQLMRNFLGSAIFYFYAYVRVMKIYKAIVAAQTAKDEEHSKDQQSVFESASFSASKRILHREQTGGTDQPNLDDLKKQFAEARKEQQARLEKLAQSYAKIILSCSNFEQGQDDLLFFECMYHFTILLIRQSVDSTPFDAKQFGHRVQCELCHIFRGPNFDIQSKLVLKEEIEKENQKREKLREEMKLSNFDSSNTKGGNAVPKFRKWYMSGKEKEQESGATHTNPDGDLPPNKYIGIQSLQIGNGYDIYQPIQWEVDHSSQDAALFGGMGSLNYQFHNNLARTTKRRKLKKEKFSIHKALHARSPIVSLLLPQPQKLAEFNRIGLKM